MYTYRRYGGPTIPDFFQPDYTGPGVADTNTARVRAAGRKCLTWAPSLFKLVEEPDDIQTPSVEDNRDQARHSPVPSPDTISLKRFPTSSSVYSERPPIASPSNVSDSIHGSESNDESYLSSPAGSGSLSPDDSLFSPMSRSQTWSSSPATRSPRSQSDNSKSSGLYCSSKYRGLLNTPGMPKQLQPAYAGSSLHASQNMHRPQGSVQPPRYICQNEKASLSTPESELSSGLSGFSVSPSSSSSQSPQDFYYKLMELRSRSKPVNTAMNPYYTAKDIVAYEWRAPGVSPPRRRNDGVNDELKKEVETEIRRQLLELREREEEFVATVQSCGDTPPLRFRPRPKTDEPEHKDPIDALLKLYCDDSDSEPEEPPSTPTTKLQPIIASNVKTTGTRYLGVRVVCHPPSLADMNWI